MKPALSCWKVKVWLWKFLHLCTLPHFAIYLLLQFDVQSQVEVHFSINLQNNRTVMVRKLANRGFSFKKPHQLESQTIYLKFHLEIGCFWWLQISLVSFTIKQVGIWVEFPSLYGEKSEKSLTLFCWKLTIQDLDEIQIEHKDCTFRWVNCTFCWKKSYA